MNTYASQDILGMAQGNTDRVKYNLLLYTHKVYLNLSLYADKLQGVHFSLRFDIKVKDFAGDKNHYQIIEYVFPKSFQI